MKYDYKTLYEKNANLYLPRPFLKKSILFLNIFLTAVFFVAYVALWVYVAFFSDFERSVLTEITFCPMLALLLVSVLRLAIHRPRPYAKDGAQIVPFFTKKIDEKHSFPSRHLACATTIALAFSGVSTGLCVLLFIFALLLAYLRFTVGVHYPTDLLAGALIGIVPKLLLLLLL